MYYYHPHTGQFDQGTRRSVRAQSYSLGTTKRGAYDDLYVPFTHIYHRPYDTYGSEYVTRSEINRELIMSSAAMEDNYDITNKSRLRDKEVLAAANRAINTPTGSLKAYKTTSLRGDAQSAKRRSTKVSTKPPSRSHCLQTSLPAYQSLDTPSYVTSTNAAPLDLRSSPKPSPFLKYSKTQQSHESFSKKSYQPIYSQTVNTLFSPNSHPSPYRFNSSIRSPSPATSSRSRLIEMHHKPPLFQVSTNMVGNYYNSVTDKRNSNEKEGKHWPGIDTENIETENVIDLFGTRDIGSEKRNCMVQNSVASSPMSYIYNYGGDSDIPDEYVPFKPRGRYHSPERDYSKLSVLPYLPKRDPTKNSVEDDIAFNAIVAQSAIHARKALESINWAEYDSAGLIFSVEGEYQPPKDDCALGFRYISRPITLNVPSTQRDRAKDSDNTYSKYLTDLREFGEDIRTRLEECYKALTRETGKGYPLALSTPKNTSYSMHNRPSPLPYRKHLTKDTWCKYGHNLELFPSEASASSLHGANDSMPKSRAPKIYDAKYDKDSKIAMLARIEIKVDTEIYSSPRSAVAARRATRGQSTPPMSSSTYSKTEAALIGSKMDTMLPGRVRHPRSSFAQAKMRQLRKEKREDTQTLPAENTTGLRAHRPAHFSTYSKPIYDVQGVRKPNIMSWQYRLDALVSPDDLITGPRSLASVKSQLRDAHDKLDRHRQLMDRYLVTDKGFTVEDMRVLMSIKSGVPRTEPASLNPIKQSDKVKRTRRKLMRKHQSSY